MEANELMIGDYVIRKNVPKEILIVDTIDSIRDIVYLDLDGLGITEKLENIEPIPLTPKILEKNGFVQSMSHNWLIVIDNIMIEIREPEHNIAIWLDWAEHETETYASYMLPGPNYVHELQHALRLCNITKEIVI